MASCTQIVGHTTDAHGAPDKEIECGKPAHWCWGTAQPGRPGFVPTKEGAAVCGECRERYRGDSLFDELVEVQT